MAYSVDPDQEQSSLFWVHAVCFYTYIVSNVRLLFAADHFSRRHFQMHFLLGTSRVNYVDMYCVYHDILFKVYGKCS